MKSKSSLIVVSILLLVGVAAHAATADEATRAAGTEPEAVEAMLTPVSQPGCEAGILADLFAAPIMKLGYTNTCGSCSVTQCRGLQRGTWCAPGKWCIPTLTNFCPGTQDWDCQCASHYY